MSLTIEQRAEVAKAVSGRRVKIRSDNSIWVGGICASVPYTPMFGSDPQSRSQALALVEWLADRIIELSFAGVDASEIAVKAECEMMDAIHERNAGKLESLAHTLLEQKHG